MTNALISIMLFLPIFLFFIYIVETKKIENDLKVIIFVFAFIVYTGVAMALFQ